MELTKGSKSEMESFNDKFKKSDKKYSVRSNALGEITYVKSTDNDIIVFAKELGLKEVDKQ